MIGSIIAFISSLLVTSFIFVWGFDRAFHIHLDFIGVTTILLSLVIVKNLLFSNND